MLMKLRKEKELLRSIIISVSCFEEITATAITSLPGRRRLHPVAMSPSTSEVPVLILQRQRFRKEERERIRAKTETPFSRYRGREEAYAAGGGG
ncbi:hypothetical protein L2E82_01767 [Cichorium intybus]|uniref:Uncharacterized protein n=1 Tax=Cichorium intybus TaxID=13427 RepID=A0ACB9GZS7_CICIN|nr:hypothetical protein L2E82_01767 [Cichorium intybus]